MEPETVVVQMIVKQNLKVCVYVCLKLSKQSFLKQSEFTRL